MSDKIIAGPETSRAVTTHVMTPLIRICVVARLLWSRQLNVKEMVTEDILKLKVLPAMSAPPESLAVMTKVALMVPGVVIPKNQRSHRWWMRETCWGCPYTRRQGKV